MEQEAIVSHIRGSRTARPAHVTTLLSDSIKMTRGGRFPAKATLRQIILAPSYGRASDAAPSRD